MIWKSWCFLLVNSGGLGSRGTMIGFLRIPLHVPIVPMSVKVPMELMLYIDTLFEFAFDT